MRRPTGSRRSVGFLGLLRTGLLDADRGCFLLLSDYVYMSLSNCLSRIPDILSGHSFSGSRSVFRARYQRRAEDLGAVTHWARTNDDTRSEEAEEKRRAERSGLDVRAKSYVRESMCRAATLVETMRNDALSCIRCMKRKR
jgi:hypothetical protein